jgi:hypothetical protein
MLLSLLAAPSGPLRGQAALLHVGELAHRSIWGSASPPSIWPAARAPCCDAQTGVTGAGTGHGQLASRTGTVLQCMDRRHRRTLGTLAPNGPALCPSNHRTLPVPALLAPKVGGVQTRKLLNFVLDDLYHGAGPVSSSPPQLAASASRLGDREPLRFSNTPGCS